MGKNIPNDHKICLMTIKYFQWPLNRPNDHKRGFPLQNPPKFTQIGIFGLKTNHLATCFSLITRMAGYVGTAVNLAIYDSSSITPGTRTNDSNGLT
jgi:hypothetical protein